MPYCVAVPHEAITYYGKEFGQNPVGTGPFKFKLWRQEEKLILLKNEKYFETDSEGNALPYLEGISIRFIKDKQSEFLEFLSGKIDFLSGIHSSYKDELLTVTGHLNPSYSDRFYLLTGPYLNTEYLGILADTSLPAMKDNPLRFPEVRKAINYGFDRRKMLQYLRNNLGTPAEKGIVPYGIPFFDHSMFDGYQYKPDTARQLLVKAGFPEGKGLEGIVLTTTSDYLDLCEFIQYELAGIGINLKLEVMTGAGFRNTVANSGLPFFRASWIADYPDPENYLSLFHSDNFSPAGPNYTHFRSGLFDSLYTESIRTSDEHLRLMLYSSMDQIIMQHAAIVPLFYDRLVRIVSSDVEGFDINPLNLLVIKHVKKKM
jgi:peptide/nickel transport system substrate-binding protein